MNRFPSVLVSGALFLSAGCARLQPADYRAYLEHMPQSILVLPPLNASTALEAPDLFLSTVAKPLAERGYYVFPVAVVDRLLRDNGAPTPGDMHQIPIRKLREIFGADAVLFVTIEEWSTTYILLATETAVVVHYRLVDTATGTILWDRQVAVSDSSVEVAQGADPISIGMAIIAAQIQAVGAIFTEPEMDLARQANVVAFTDGFRGLLLGYRHPGYERDQERRLLALAEAE